MKKLIGFSAFLAVTAFAVLTPNILQAGWGASGGHGSSGYGSSGGAAYGSSGYSAGYGSSGAYAGPVAVYGGSSGGSSGVYAGYGSSGGVPHVGPLRRLKARMHEHHAAKVAYRSSFYGASSGGASSGGYASSGGSSGNVYSSGISYGSSGGSSGSYSSSYGSSGSVYQSTPSYYSGDSVIEGTSYESTPMMHGSSLRNGSEYSNTAMQVESSIGHDEIQLNVLVPADARLFVNGNATTSQGTNRQFVSRRLEAGGAYKFDIRAERTVEGQVVEETKSVVLVAGKSQEVTFALAKPNAKAETVLTLNVPADAKVVLAGNSTKTIGEQRVYRTKELNNGQVWEDYTIVVTHNGVTKEKVIRLIGGDEMQVAFNFDSNISDALASK